MGGNLVILHETFVDLKHERNHRHKERSTVVTASSSSNGRVKSTNTSKDQGTKCQALGEDGTITHCERCGRFGHVKTDCRKPKANIAEKGAASLGGTSAQAITATATKTTATTATRCQFSRYEIWVAGSRVSHHIMYSHYVIYDFKRATDNVELAGGTILIKGWNK